MNRDRGICCLPASVIQIIMTDEGLMTQVEPSIENAAVSGLYLV